MLATRQSRITMLHAKLRVREDIQGRETDAPAETQGEAQGHRRPEATHALDPHSPEDDAQEPKDEDNQGCDE